MRGDFKRGSYHDEGSSGDEAHRPDLTPRPGRDASQTFWEYIGLKPGDAWKDEAGRSGMIEDASEADAPSGSGRSGD